MSIDLKFQLKNTISMWVDRSFNFIQLSVLEKWADNCLYEYIRNPSLEEIFPDWLSDCDSSEKICSWLNNVGEENDLLSYHEFDGNIMESFIHVFGKDKWTAFKTWCCQEYEDDLIEYSQEQENYPLWNTCFEFRDSFFNNEDEIQTCLKIGLGVIQDLDSFNTIVFMTSGGHSFYSAYWIPLYLELYPDEKEKYKDVDYSDL